MKIGLINGCALINSGALINQTLRCMVTCRCHINLYMYCVQIHICIAVLDHNNTVMFVYNQSKFCAVV